MFGFQKIDNPTIFGVKYATLKLSRIFVRSATAKWNLFGDGKSPNRYEPLSIFYWHSESNDFNIAQ